MSIDRKIKSGMGIRSHLKMAIYNHLTNLKHDSQETLNTRVQFIKSLMFFHSNLDTYVKYKYLKWLWKEVENGGCGCSFEEFEKNKSTM